MATDAPAYCVRLVSKPDGSEAKCYKRIARRNAFDWCEECRARLPFWPANDAPAAQPVTAPRAQELTI